MTKEKPRLDWGAQVSLLRSRGLVIDDEQQCRAFLMGNNYYRFSGYARYFQKSPEYDDNDFVKGRLSPQSRLYMRPMKLSDLCY